MGKKDKKNKKSKKDKKDKKDKQHDKDKKGRKEDETSSPPSKPGDKQRDEKPIQQSPRRSSKKDDHHELSTQQQGIRLQLEYVSPEMTEHLNNLWYEAGMDVSAKDAVKKEKDTIETKILNRILWM